MRNAILAGISLKKTRSSFVSAMEECRQLMEACNMTVCGQCTQQSDSMDPHTAFRRGKLQELASMVQETGADGVVFLNRISVQAAERIADICGVDVIDRTSLILEIFSRRARTKNAMLQTEMARLKYDLPRLLNDKKEDSEHARSSFNNRGAGEMRSAVIERRYSRRISALKKELEKLDGQRGMDEHRRSKTLFKRVALVGYTNAGKSSLLNCFVKKFASLGTLTREEDMLFATLDTSVRKITVNKQSFFLYDTVGFVSDLPHELIDAFKSTLDSAREADILVHVVDYSDADYEEKIAVTMDTLKEIGADHIPLLRVFNKADLVKEERKQNAGLVVSCRTGEGMQDAAEKILSLLYPKEDSGLYLVPYNRLNDFERYKSVLHCDVLGHKEDGMLVHMAGEKKYLDIFRHVRIEGGLDENSLGKV